MNLRLSLCAAVIALAVNANASEIPDSCRQNGIAIGCQAWSFNRYTAYEAIEKTAESGGKIIELYPGQKISATDAGKIGPDMTDEQITALKAQLDKCGVRAVNFGVTGVSNKEEEARKLFAFAKKLDLYAITTESTGSIDMIEKMVKEFDICVAYHNHPRKEKDANYKVWDPNYILELIKGRDPRIGACADIGHWATSGIVPLDGLKILDGHIISVHLKERTKIGGESHDVPAGTGISNIAGCLAELKRQGFKGNISVEYEHNWEKSVPEITQSIDYVRKVGKDLAN